MIKTLMGTCQPEVERKKTFRMLVYFEALILFDYLFSSLPLTILTIVETIGYGAFFHFRDLNYVTIFCLIKFIGAAGAAFVNSKTLYFEMYGIYKQPKSLKVSPTENSSLVNSVHSSNSALMTTVGSIQATTIQPNTNPGKSSFQQKVDAARQSGDKAEVNRLREIGDVGYVQNTIRLLEKNKGDRVQIEATLDEETKKYETIYRSRLYTAKSLKDPEEEAHVVSLFEETSKKLRNLRNQYLI